MKPLLFLTALLFTASLVNSQPKQKVASQKIEQTSKKDKDANSYDDSPKKYLTTKTYYDEKNPARGYINETVEFFYNDNSVIKKASGIKYIYKVANTRIDEWGTTVCKAMDSEGNICIWRFGKSNMGIPFAQFEDATRKITYNDDFK